MPNPVIIRRLYGGVNPNRLLNGLVHYYQLETFASNQVIDTIGGVTLSATNAGADASLITGKIGNCIKYSGAGGINGLTNPGPNNVNFLAAAGISESYSCWFWFDAGNPTATPAFFSFFDASGATQFGAFFLDTVSGTVRFEWRNAADSNVVVTWSIAPTSGAWHHAAMGYDSPNNVLWIQVDNGARQTIAMPNLKGTNTSFGVNMFFIRGFGFELAGRVDEWGVWNNRALSTTDVANLWNGGAGLPFSKFTH
jgi:hypothetical protein